MHLSRAGLRRLTTRIHGIVRLLAADPNVPDRVQLLERRLEEQGAALAARGEALTRAHDALSAGHAALARTVEAQGAALDALSAGHAALARAVEAHLAALQGEADRWVASERSLAQDIESLRTTAAGLEAALSDVEEYQSWLSATIARERLERLPE
jgi:hypothetical protein